MAKAAVDIRSLARQHTSLAISTLAAICRKGKSEPARVSAAAYLIERGWGKAPQDVSMQADIRVTIRKILTDDDSELIDVTPDPKKLETTG